MGHGSAQHGGIGGSAARKIEGKQHGGNLRQLRYAQEGVAGKNFEVGPRPAAQGSQHQAFKRAGGMVGKKHHRPLGGDALKVAAQAFGVYVQRREAGGSKGMGVAALGQGVGHFFQPRKTRKLTGHGAGQPSDASDQRSAWCKG